jgi:hypothetical protein
VDVLDEAAFGEEGLDLRIAGEDVEIADEFQEALLAAPPHAQVGGGYEVGADPALEAARLADVDDDAAGVFHQVDARGFGEDPGLFAEAWEAHGIGLGGALEGDGIAGFFDNIVGLEGVGIRAGGMVGIDLRVEGLIGGEFLGGEVVVGLGGRGHGTIIVCAVVLV